MSTQEVLAQVARDHRTPCFVYFLDEAYRTIDAIRHHFGGRFEISYAVKSNPNAVILDRLRDRVEGLDISSAGELRRALAAGWSAGQLSFTGPAKRPEELEAAVAAGIGNMIVESVAEARQLSEIAAAAGVRQSILVRVAPLKVPRGFGVRMAGKPSQFGIDEEDLDASLDQIRGLAALDLRGFHIYSGTQCLVTESLVEHFEICADIFRRFSERFDVVPTQLVFGAGFGLPYHERNEPVDLPAVADGVNPVLDSLREEQRFKDTAFVFETGRYIIGEAGYYLTSVVSRKRSRGAEICICDGGMNHHSGACGHLGGVIQRNYRLFKVCADGPEPADQDYDLVGPLCTTIDTLGRSVTLPRMEVGDVIAVCCSGAYGVTASPLLFISHDPPREVLVETREGRATTLDITQALLSAGSEP